MKLIADHVSSVNITILFFYIRNYICYTVGIRVMSDIDLTLMKFDNRSLQMAILHQPFLYVCWNQNHFENYAYIIHMIGTRYHYIFHWDIIVTTQLKKNRYDRMKAVRIILNISCLILREGED